jgi:uncharacterized protein (TIGR02186 family)
MKKLLAIALIFFCANAQAAAPLIADLSNYQITMDSTFNGTRLFVFGTRNDVGDVVVVVRGPTKDYIVRKKEKIAGVWVNAERVKLYDTPDFYAVASSKPLEQITHLPALQALGIGRDQLFVSRFNAAKNKEFTDAFMNYQRTRGLYRQPAELTFMGETLFKTAIDFPDNIPPGMYNAEIYLLKDNAIAGTHTIPIEVEKVGIDAFLYDYAHNKPFFYGLTAVVLALCAGWFAGRLFERI